MAFVEDTDLAAAGAGQGANMVGFIQDGTGAVQRTAMEKLRETVSVMDFGAVGDGVADDSAAFQAAVNASKYLYVPIGRYLFGSPVALSDGQLIVGAGKSAWEPYNADTTGTPFPAVTKSEILVDGTLAFDATGTNNAALRGLSIKAVGGTQSKYGTPAAYQAGALGIDITDSSQFECDDCSFFGLETAILAVQGVATQIPKITDWTASDCDKVFRFGDSSSDAYVARDVHINNCSVAIHNNGIIEAHCCDGIRIENSRFFPNWGTMIYLRATDFVSIIGTTTFETSEDAVVLDTCHYVTMAGMKIVRAGAYLQAPPWPQKRGLVLTNCTDVSFQGLIQQVTGRPIDISGCVNVNIDTAIGFAFWTTGNEQNTDGAINVTTSDIVNINASITGSQVNVGVWADAQSSRSLTGTAAMPETMTVVRAHKLDQQRTYVHRLDADVGPISAGGTLDFHNMRVFVPAGKILTAWCVEMTSPDVRLRVGSSFWLDATTTEPGGGSVDISGGKVLYDNSAGVDAWISVPLQFYNAGAGVITVPGGHETRISMVTIDPALSTAPTV